MASSNTVTIDVVADTTSAIRSINTLSSSITKTLAGLTATIAAAVVGIGKESLEAYSEYEQLVDGIAIMFGDSADQLLENANNAFSTAQVSANSYLESVSDFGMLLINSLDGDTETAVGYVEMALEDMADISNAFGLELEEVSDVYKSLSRGIYRTLDNLQLGYAGTKTGLEALIEDANEYAETIGETGDLTADSYADIIQAIDYIIEKQGLAGIAAYEATETLQGSLNTLQAVWENWLLGLADEDADLSELTENLVVGLENVAKNVLPRIEQIGEGLVAALPEAVANAAATVAPMLAESIAAIWNTASALLSEYTSIDIGTIDASDVEDAVASIGEVFQGLWDIVEPVVEWLVGTAVPALVDFFDAFSKYIPDATVLWLVASAVSGIGSAFGGIVTKVEKALPTIMTILDPISTVLSLAPNIKSFGDAWYLFSDGIGGTASTIAGLVGPIALVVAAVVSAVAIFASWYSSSDSFRETVDGLIETVTSLASGIGESLSPLVSSIINVFQSLYTYAEPVISSLIDAVAMLVETVAPYLETIATAVSSAFAPIFDWISSVLLPVISVIATELIDVALPILATIAEFIMGTLATAISTVSLIIQLAWAAVETVLNSALMLVTTIFSAIWAVVYPIVYTIWQFISAAFQGIFGTVSTAMTEVYEAISSALENARQAFQNAITTISNAVQSIYDAVTGVFENVSATFEEFGVDIIDGLVDGITSSVLSAVKAVKSALSDIVSAGKEFLGISSPSKVFAEIGGFSMQGLAEGIEDAASEAISAVSSVVDDVTSAAQGIVTDVTVGLAFDDSALQGIDSSSTAAALGTTINQTFETKVVRSDSDLYTAAPIIYRNAMREASLA